MFHLVILYQLPLSVVEHYHFFPVYFLFISKIVIIPSSTQQPNISPYCKYQLPKIASFPWVCGSQQFVSVEYPQVISPSNHYQKQSTRCCTLFIVIVITSNSNGIAINISVINFYITIKFLTNFLTPFIPW